jgi:iron complex outermembrane receptor protein
MRTTRKSAAFAALAGVCLAAGATAPGSVLAAEEAALLEEIVVTGSRIKRDTFSSPAPIEVLSTEDARAIGVTSLTEMLQRSTAASGQQFDGSINNNSGNSNATEAPTPGGPGSSNIGLRGLGPERTLVLLNGRRLGAAGVRGAPSQPDINLLPLNLVESVEVVTEGASSIYGADAVAGVVNVILRDEFEGFEITLNGDLPEETGGESRQASFITGASTDRARFVLAGDYYKRERLSLGDREDCIRSRPITQDGQLLERCRNTFPDNLAAPLDFLVDGDPTTAFFGAWYRPGVSEAESDIGVENFVGTFQLPAPTGVNEGDEGVDAGNRFGFIPFYSDADERLASDLVTPIERFSVVALGGFSPGWFGGDEELYYEVSYNNRQVTNRATTEQIFPGVPMDLPQEDANGNIIVDATGAPILVDDPRNPFDSDDWNFDPVVVVTLEDAPQLRETELDQIRLVGGFRGDFPSGWFADNNWSYDVFASYDRGKGFVDQPVINETNLNMALSTARFDADGNIICGVDPRGDTFGFFTPQDCVPVNMFADNIFVGGEQGEGAFAPDERDFLIYSRINRTVVEQTMLAGYLTGDLVELWNGETVAVAVGAEYREDEIDSDTEFLGQTGSAATETTLTEGPTRGQRDLMEFYAEFAAPLIVGAPGIELLQVEGAARYTDESNFGNETTYRARVVYRPVDWVSVSGSFGTSFRAPNLREQFLGEQFTGTSANSDPCTIPSEANIGGVYQPQLDTRSQTVIDNCIQSGADPTVLGLGAGTTIPVRVGGNVDDLEAETSESFTATIQVSPPIGDEWELDLALSYWDIEVKDTVRSIGASVILDRCFSDAPNLASPFCDRVTRDSGPGAPPDTANFVSEVDASFVNIGEETSVGYDFSTRLGTDFDVLGGVRVVWQQKLTRQIEAGEEVFAGGREDQVGDFGLPEWRYNTSIRAMTGPWEFVTVGRYIGETDASRDARIANDSCDVFGTSLSLPGSPMTRSDCSADEAWYWDASATYAIDETFRISGGVNNIADASPAYVSQAAGSNRGGRVVGSGYDQFGRSYFLSLTKTF